jgi:hypothetical protein
MYLKEYETTWFFDSKTKGQPPPVSLLCLDQAMPYEKTSTSEDAISKVDFC